MVPAQLLQLVDEGRNLRISIEKYGQELDFIQEFELLRFIDVDFNQGIRLVLRFEPKCVRLPSHRLMTSINNVVFFETRLLSFKNSHPPSMFLDTAGASNSTKKRLDMVVHMS